MGSPKEQYSAVDSVQTTEDKFLSDQVQYLNKIWGIDSSAPDSAAPGDGMIAVPPEKEGSASAKRTSVRPMQVVAAGVSVTLTAFVYVSRPVLTVAAPASGAALGLGMYAAVGLLTTLGNRIFSPA